MKTKILYVEDEVLNRKLFELHFSRKYEVYIAEDGLQGLDVLDNHTDIFVIISDMKMPGMNGLEFIRKAKESYPLKKYFILTGFEISQEIEQALDSGLILKYFRKPFNAKEIESVIDSVIAV